MLDDFPEEDYMTDVRCFRKLHDEPAAVRRGVWLMTGEKRGMFFHGEREEAQAPRWTISRLKDCERESVNGGELAMHIQEISCNDALRELESWPEAQEQARKIIARHEHA